MMYRVGSVFRVACVGSGRPPEVSVYLLEWRGCAPDAREVERAMRRAVAEYLATEEGAEVVRGNHGFFNWGDAAEHVPDDIWRRHGLEFLGPAGAADIVLDQEDLSGG